MGEGILDLFPRGMQSYLLGGLIIGLGVSVIYLTTGLLAGASGVLTSTWSWLSQRPGFQLEPYVRSRAWRATFSLGLVAGAVVFTLAWNRGEMFVTEVQAWRLAAGGFLVGLGTRVSRGCTSGHGVCGLSAWSLPSLSAVVTFMGVAILTAVAATALGVTP